MEILTWLETTDLSIWVKESYFGYYILLNGHAIGMAVVVGVVFMLNLRVLGFGQRLPLSVFNKLVSLGWFAFALNFVTGAILFAAQGLRYLDNAAFVIKIMLILVGGVSMWLLARILNEAERSAAVASVGAAATTGTAVVSGSARLFAFLSLVFWIGAIIAGRLIAYTLGPPPPPTL